METKIGIVEDYDGYRGKIVTENKTYMFLETDLLEDVFYSDFVEFKSEEEKSIKRAYLVKRIDKPKIKN